TWSANDEKVRVTDIMTVQETVPHLIEGFEGRARAFVQIQQGCDHRCTFCIIPFARGPNRSVGMGHLVDQFSKLVDQGFKEVVLTGVDICSYGDDLPGRPRLGDMVAKLLAAAPGLARLRLSSLDPAAMDDRLFDLIADEPRLMSHLHLSLQAMDDMVLKRMKRRHTREDGVAVVERIRQARPGAAIGADLIVGFPTETDEMFKNTLKAVKSLRLSHLHVFPYSVRKGTPAAKMPGVSADVIKARSAVLRETGHAELTKLCASQVGSIARVLIENAGEGHSEHYIPVSVKGATEPGTIFDVRIEEFTKTGLKGVTI
ncbi:MAG: MiaB/RimO family radical SAM methylthiotransferase, partial [Rhodospirillales bacterium]|nr:MiaB/RimO family radical SAM methylthiotransferase [Rhodospirillales bacterium]